MLAAGLHCPTLSDSGGLLSAFFSTQQKKLTTQSAAATQHVAATQPSAGIRDTGRITDATIGPITGPIATVPGFTATAPGGAIPMARQQQNPPTAK